MRLPYKLLSLGLLCVPTIALAAMQINWQDTIAGLGTTIQISGADSGATANITVTPPRGNAFRKTSIVDRNGNAMIELPGSSLQRAGTYSITADVDGVSIPTDRSLAVIPDALDSALCDVIAWNPRIRSDGVDRSDITVTIRDAYGNPLAGHPIMLVSSRTSDSIRALTPETDGQGEQQFQLSSRTAGTAQLRAVDLLTGQTVGDTLSIQVGVGSVGGEDAYYPSPSASNNGQRFYGTSQFYAAVGSFDLIDAFEITGPSQMDAGVEQTISVRAIDRNGNTVQDYLGTVTFDSTDPDPATILPNRGSYTFKDRDQGEKKFPLGIAFGSPGVQTLRVYDRTNPQPENGPFGTFTVTVGGHSASNGGKGISVSSPLDGDTVNTSEVLVEGVGPRFANLVVTGGTRDATGSSDANGSFKIPVPLSASMKNVTLRVQDDTKRNDSGPINITVDLTPPQIQTVTFAPERPEAGQKTLAIVQSEPKLQQVQLKIPASEGSESQTIPLNETESGAYQAFFTAPLAGAYQVVVSALDRAGNTQELRSTLSVGSQSLPQVQKVKAEARINAASLQWDPLNVPLDGYRVYVGETPTDYLYTLDTNRVITKATVAGLTPGKTYYFAVTALKGEMESKDKSEPASAMILGLTLDIKPGNGSLQVKWNSLNSSTVQIGTYLLEYGTEPDQLTETRTLNGQVKETTIRDLISGLPYYVILTPITVTGDKVAELAAKGQGTPTGAGFTAGPRDDIPFEALSHPGNTVKAPTETPGSGLPPWGYIAAIVVGCLGGIALWRKRVHARSNAAFLRMVEEQYRNRV